MQVVTGAMSTLLPKLANLLTEEYKLQKNIKGEVMFLKAELESMEAALLKVSEASIDDPPDNQVKLWAREVRELSYEIEDSVDEFMVRLDTCVPTKDKPPRFSGFFEKVIDLLTRAKIRHKIGTGIKDIKSRIKEVSERRDRYKLDAIAAKPIGQTVDSLRLAALYKKTSELVGTKESSEELIKLLMVPEQEQLMTVSIVGIGGVGKTTLAKIVYDKLKWEFKCKAFVSVSFNPKITNVLSNMLHQLGNSKCEETWNEAQLIDEIRKFLSGKRYIIVIDDIWTISVWEKIQYALINNKRGSKIIITTRKLDVAKQASVFYPLKPLSASDSKKLFYLRIFGSEDKCPPSELARISENILRKCGGVPLAIITIASLLARKMGKENIYYWSKVYQSMGSGLEDSSDVQDMRRILSVSYYDLPPHLKTCLLYLSLYPEDYEINTEALIWKLIGEGFVRKEEGKAIYEVGENYVNELVNRSLIQPETIDPDEMVITFRLHDMVLDLITCLSNEDHFLTILDGHRSICLANKIRRLSFQTNDENDLKQLSQMNLSHVRSLTVTTKASNLLPSLFSCPFLRALDLSGCNQMNNHHFRDICNLFHIRHLGLRSTRISEIPKEIGNLQFLQVLDIAWTDIEELPSTFVQLRRLVYLNVDYLKGVPNGFGNLKCMQELIGYIDVESPAMLHELNGLAELRCITLRFYDWDKSYKKPFLQWLSSMVSLRYLEVHGCNGSLGSQCDILSPGPQQLQRIEMVCSTIHTVPRWMTSLSTLSSVSITLRRLGEEELQLLGNMPSLISLSMQVKEKTKDRDRKLCINNGYPFSFLQKLRIRQTVEIAFAPGAIQNLKSIHLAFKLRHVLDQFGDFDFGLENLSLLVDICVEMNCSNARPAEVESAGAAIRRAVDLNPNRPKLTLVPLLVDWTK